MLTLDEIEQNVKILMSEGELDDDFIYGLLRAYGKPKSSISRLKSGTTNQSNDSSVVSLKKVVYYKVESGSNLLNTIDTLQKDAQVAKTFPRFIIVTNLINLLAVDTKTKDTLDIEIKDIEKNVAFFLPLSGPSDFTSSIESLVLVATTYAPSCFINFYCGLNLML